MHGTVPWRGLNHFSAGPQLFKLQGFKGADSAVQSFPSDNSRAGKKAQRVKGLASQACWPKFDSQEPI